LGNSLNLFSDAIGSVRSILFYAGLIAGALFDLKYRRIPNFYVVLFFLAGLVVCGLGAGVGGVLQGLTGAGVGLLLLLGPFAMGLVGGGDVKFLAAMGVWLGLDATVMAAGVGFVFGGGFVVLLLLGRPGLRREVSQNLWGAFLAQSLPKIGKRSSRLSVPLGAALAMGGLLTDILGWAG